MARPQRIQFPNAIYLVTLHGVAGMGLFVEPADAEHFRSLLGLLARKHAVTLHAYALVDNTGELVVHTPGANLSAFLQGLKTAFARQITNNYVHQGPIFQGRFLSKLVEPALLTAVTARVHTLPARLAPDATPPAQRKTLAAKHPFTSLGEYRDPRSDAVVDTIPVLKGMGSPPKTRAERFVTLCLERAATPDTELDARMTASPLAIGSEAFVAEMNTTHRKLAAKKAGRGLRIYGKKTRGLARGKIFDTVAEVFGVERAAFTQRTKNDPVRPALAHLLQCHAEMTQGEIAKVLNVGTSAAVSQQIRRHLEAVATDEALAKKMKSIGKKLGISL